MLKAQSGINKPSRLSSQCTPDCVQVACVGDCPDKVHATSVCPKCDRKGCSGICKPTPYSNHSRLPADLDTSANVKAKARAQRPKSCSSCLRVSNPARETNAQQLSLGRPKSSHTTYSRARKSVRRTTDLRKTPTDLSANIDRDQLRTPASGCAITSPPRARSARTRRGRDSIAPHKSYNSQRRISLTTATIRPVFGVNLANGKQRAKSARSYYWWWDLSTDGMHSQAAQLQGLFISYYLQ